MDDRMTAVWEGGRRFTCRSASGHDLIVDAPAEAGGAGAGPTPLELLLLGLLGCTGIDVASILEKMRQPLTGLEVAATFARAEDHPRIYTKIHVSYRLEGDLDPAKVARAIALSETTFCSASAMLGKAAEITSEFRIIK